jgi:hypothetical protein
MDFNIDQTRTRGESLSHDCDSLFRSTELLAFDFIFADSLMGQVPAAQVYTFLEQCIRPRYNLSTGSSADFEQAAQHVKYLQDLIGRCASDLLHADLRRPDIPKRTSEFVVYLKDQKMRLDKKLSRSRRPDCPPESLDVVEVSEDDAETEDLPSSFSKWLQSELKVGSDPNEESVELRCLVRSVAHRLAAVAQLHEGIQRMKQEILDPDDLDYTDCLPQDLIESPFFLGVRNSCGFLLAAFNALQAQQELVPKCFDALAKCRQRLGELLESSKAGVSEMQRHIAKMQQVINKRRQEAAELRGELQPFIDSIFSRTPLPSIPEVEPDDLLSKLREDLEAAVQGNPDRVREIEADIELLELRREIAGLCRQRNALITQIAERDRTMLGFVMDHCKGEEDIRMQQTEVELMQRYEDGLKEVLDSLKFTEMGSWCDELGAIGASFAELARTQQCIVDELERICAADDIEAQTAAKRKEIEELSVVNYRMCAEIGRAKLELDSVLEEQFRAQQNLEMYRQWLPAYIDRENEQAVQEYTRRIMCPICQANKRDCILSCCGHCMCRVCLERAPAKKCPICKIQFTEQNLKPFFLQ